MEEDPVHIDWRKTWMKSTRYWVREDVELANQKKNEITLSEWKY